jgi:hypothetical protein
MAPAGQGNAQPPTDFRERHVRDANSLGHVCGRLGPYLIEQILPLIDDSFPAHRSPLLGTGVYATASLDRSEDFADGRNKGLERVEFPIGLQVRQAA